jgi:8-oxo-dGTP pyrophosphatase MutT (NUDIX family)
METTRHFCATVYVVRDGETALHHHRRAQSWLPPGGHINRDELPRSAAHREVREELGLEVSLREPGTSLATDRVRERPGPERLLLVDVHHYGDDSVAHQHFDFVYYGLLEEGAIDPVDDGLEAEDWEWFSRAELQADETIQPDVTTQGREAIDAFSG